MEWRSASVTDPLQPVAGVVSQSAVPRLPAKTMDGMARRALRGVSPGRPSSAGGNGEALLYARRVHRDGGDYREGVRVNDHVLLPFLILRPPSASRTHEPLGLSAWSFSSFRVAQAASHEYSAFGRGRPRLPASPQRARRRFQHRPGFLAVAVAPLGVEACVPQRFAEGRGVRPVDDKTARGQIPLQR